uniref:Cilia- and flagella-associated protein 91 n=1 Tax=Glossina pallidipes TaxID=7398 RepID=A0A1B0AJM6_GLOPL
MAFSKQLRKSGGNALHKTRYINLEFENSIEMSSASTSTDTDIFFVNYINNERRPHSSSRLLTGSEDTDSLHNNVGSKRRRLSGGAGSNTVEELPQANINTINLKLSDDYSVANRRTCRTHEKKPKGSQVRGTQTLYRESSAQTLPFLPRIWEDRHKLEDTELSKLPTILPGDGPPGLYEVEVLERARKRWAFLKAFKLDMQRKQKAARERIQNIKHRRILEAFEWEHWIEREEFIQECQMLRLEILIRMFNDREQRMHKASNKRISMSYEKIDQRRKAALKKNKVEYDRALRALNMKHANQSRVWRKQPITYDLGNSNSEYYAPKMRYGVNPNRRHFKPSRNAFDKRMNDLEKQIVKMNSEDLKCPFAKLKEWSKPKQNIKEYEQNFCSDNNLKKLYENLKYLRQSFQKDRPQPQCLAAKIKLEAPTTEEDENSETCEMFAADLNVELVGSFTQTEQEESEGQVEEETTFSEKQDAAKRQQDMDESTAKMEAAKLDTMFLNNEFRNEECEGLIQFYEGSTIGWLMRFLGEELQRAEEQRKLHFYCMLAQRERWHREAVEAGLRQKENCMRATYEKIYRLCCTADRDVAEKYLEKIIDNDIENFSAQVAEDDVIKMAQAIDKKTEKWLQSFREIQNPLNYDQLRCALREDIIPDKERIICETERNSVINHIIYDILLQSTFEKTESYDISNLIANEIIDRLIDTDLYYESTESSSVDGNRDADQEIHAILRKLVRYAVPGRRYFTPEERIFRNEVFDFLDEIFKEIDAKEPACLKEQHLISMDSHADVHIELRKRQRYYSLESELPRSSEIQIADWQVQNLVPQDYGKTLKPEEQLLLMDTDQLSVDKYLMESIRYVRYLEVAPERPTVRIIPSSHQLLHLGDFAMAPDYAPSDDDDGAVEEYQPGIVTAELSEDLESLLSVSDEHEALIFADRYKEDETKEATSEKQEGRNDDARTDFLCNIKEDETKEATSEKQEGRNDDARTETVSEGTDQAKKDEEGAENLEGKTDKAQKKKKQNITLSTHSREEFPRVNCAPPPESSPEPEVSLQR